MAKLPVIEGLDNLAIAKVVTAQLQDSLSF